MAKAAKLDKFETPAKIKLLPEQWTPESGLVTAALKIKREPLKAKFKNELQKLYAWDMYWVMGSQVLCAIFHNVVLSHTQIL